MNATRTRKTSSKQSASKSTRGRAQGGGNARKGAKAAQGRGAAKGGATRKSAAKGGATRKTASKRSAGTQRSAARGSAGRSRTPVGQAIELLIADHQEVQKLFRQGERAKGDPERLREIVETCCEALTQHADIEEQYFYPVMREATRDTDMIAEAEVEHGSARQLIEQLQGGDPQDEQYAATFKVLGEYVKHHVKEEEKEIFPRARRARGDFEPLLQALQARDEAEAEGTDMMMGGEGAATQGRTGGARRGRGSEDAMAGALQDIAGTSGETDGMEGGEGGRRSGSRGRQRSRAGEEEGGEGDLAGAGSEGGAETAQSGRRARRSGGTEAGEDSARGRGEDNDEQASRGARSGSR